MVAKKNILILCSDNYKKQPRVLRTIEALSDDFNIAVAGNSDSKDHKVNFIDLSLNLKKNKVTNYWHFNKPFFIKLPISFYYKFIKQKRFYKPFFFEQQYWTDSKLADLEQLKAFNHDLIISHGIDTLPLAITLANNKTPVIFNAHEYYPLEFEQDKIWLKTEGAKSNYIINKYLPKCVHMFCVSNLIQKKYQENLKITSTVITNAPNFIQLEPKNIDPKRIRIIHHGIALREREIEHMAKLVNHLDDRFELNIMLTVADKKYYRELEQKFLANKKVNLLPAVPLNTLCTFLNQFDIGYYILPPVNFNTKYALPNKLFEYIQARLCLAFGPSPEMKNVIEKYNLGVVANDYSPEAVADKIKALSTDDIFTFKLNSHKHALELSAEGNHKKILEIVKNQFLN